MKDAMVAWTLLGCQEEHAAKQVPRFRAWRSAWWIQPRTCGSEGYLHGCAGQQLSGMQFGCLLQMQRRQRINSARPQRRHAERGGGDAEHHADGAEGDGEIER
jgi:hypothetical protein